MAGFCERVTSGFIKFWGFLELLRRGGTLSEVKILAPPTFFLPLLFTIVIYHTIVICHQRSQYILTFRGRAQMGGLSVC